MITDLTQIQESYNTKNIAVTVEGHTQIQESYNTKNIAVTVEGHTAGNMSTFISGTGTFNISIGSSGHQ
jgi:hypothetical protein